MKDTTTFAWPAVDGEPEIRRINTTIDGILDASGSFVRVFWAWESSSAHLALLRAQIGGQTASQAITVSTLRRWVLMQSFGSAAISLDGHRIYIPASGLIVLLGQIDQHNGPRG